MASSAAELDYGISSCKLITFFILLHPSCKNTFVKKKCTLKNQSTYF